MTDKTRQWMEEESKLMQREAAEQFVKDAEATIKLLRLLKEKGAVRFETPPFSFHVPTEPQPDVIVEKDT